MQQAGFLSKLYEIQPFKIVESPQTVKRLPQAKLSLFQLYQPASQLSIPMSSLLPATISSQSSSKTNQVLKKVDGSSNTPSKKTNRVQIQLPGSNQKSSQRFIRKYSIQQPCSPISRHTFEKSHSISQNQCHKIKCSPIKTPNKQNSIPLGTMIQSHLYTSLSSSIDTLFSKIQKIKQQFQCPNNSKNPTANQDNEDNKNRSKKQQKCHSKSLRESKYKMVTVQDCQLMGQYSPILKARVSKENEISSMSSFSPLLNTSHKNPLNKKKQQQKRQSFLNSKKLVNNLYKQNALSDLQSIQSFDPVVLPLPATHTLNINEMSNKTKSIIDEINLLLDSNKKNNPYKQKQKLEKQKNNNKINGKLLRKVHTLQNNQTDFQKNCEPHDMLKNPANINPHIEKQNMVCDQYDELDDQFITIKLKPMQSDLPPKTVYKANSNNSINSSDQKKKCTNPTKLDTNINHINFNYKIQQPLFSEFAKLPQKIQQNYCYQIPCRNGVSQDIEKSNIVMTSLSMRDFQLGRCVGSGKFGDVHICKHKATGFIFAIKKIFKSTIAEYGMINQFIQQLKIHYKISNSHPNITKLYTHFHDQYHIFLLMEYIEEGTLMNHLKKQQEFVSTIVLQVLNAVEYLHRNDIAHRDIKPENILFTHGVAKVCDFGWSSQFKDEMKKTFCGTLDYVSPEMKDRGQYTTSVDLWSIGVLTFELLTGFPPYKKQIDRWRIMGGKIQDRWRWDVIFPPQISDCAKSFMQKLLKQNPDERMSIRQCRQQEFIIKFNAKQSQFSRKIAKQFSKILQ